MQTIVGIRPTGKLHIGHYFSVIKPALEEKATVLIANLHAPDSVSEEVVYLREELESYGIKKIVVQSEVFNAKTYFYFLEHTTFGELRRMTQFKTYKQTPHLLTYPVLMASDLVGYDKVIVGEDQKQHIELANRLFKRLDYPTIKGDFRGGRIMSLTNPKKKMSKSEPDGCLFLEDNFEEKLRKAVTTPEGIKNLKYIAKQFGVQWNSKNNLESKIRLAKALERSV